MNGNSGNNPHIIGLTGSFGSGCTYIAEKVLSSKGYEHLSLSKDVLRPMFQEETGYNEVPAHEKPCTQEYKNCHRDWLTGSL